MPRDAVSRTANVGTVGKNVLIAGKLDRPYRVRPIRPRHRLDPEPRVCDYGKHFLHLGDGGYAVLLCLHLLRGSQGGELWCAGIFRRRIVCRKKKLLVSVRLG